MPDRIMIATEAGQILGWYMGRLSSASAQKAGGISAGSTWLTMRRSKDGARSFLVPDAPLPDAVWRLPAFARFEGFAP